MPGTAQIDPEGSMRPIGSVSMNPVHAKPKLDPVTSAGRKALNDQVTKVLFNAKNPAGAQFRDACVAWRTPADQKAFKADMLKQAAAWSPAAAGWEKSTNADGGTVYAGRFGGLYSEVRFPKGTGKPEIFVELD